MANKRVSKKVRRAAETPEQKAERGRREIAALAANAGVPEPQIERGFHQMGTVVDLDGSLGGKRNSMVKVLINRGGTAIDRWIAHDKAGLFGEPQQNAIRYCQNLWIRASGSLAAIDHTQERIDAPLGWSQQEAFAELAWLERRMPEAYWNVYENVCRWDEEAGVAGSRLASNSRSAIDAAKTTVAFAASLIAMWRRL
ncbi:hypothetical protein ACFB49_42690 [Sphingomonas sp. DBB INV C78]|uniref:hypothetical protein n=1 Tax=Sphingomonas sp. DBB INV C78 TaxID=3349434 RepID=UPI0036D38835